MDYFKTAVVSFTVLAAVALDWCLLSFLGCLWTGNLMQAGLMVACVGWNAHSVFRLTETWEAIVRTERETR